MKLWRRSTVCALMAVGLVTAYVPVAESQNRPGRQNADQARQGEDNLDDLLRRFGADARGLKEKIDRAVDTGVEYLISQQQADGHWVCYDQGPSGYPMGGTAFCALAVKKSMVGLYEGTERELEREIRSLERKEKSGRITAEEQGQLNYMREHGAADIAKREKYAAVVAKALEWIKAKYKEIKGQGMMALGNGQSVAAYRTYDIGVILMLLEAYYTVKQETRDGYAMAVDQRRIPRDDKSWIEEMVAWLSQTANNVNYLGDDYEGKGWRYPGAASDGSTVDNSNIQYAVLGLKAAQRMGVNLPDPNLWKQIANYFITTQDPDGPAVPRKPPAQDSNTGEYFFPQGYSTPQESDKSRGWGYMPKRDAHHPTTGAMTTAALAALITAKSGLHDAGLLDRDPAFNDRIDRSINDAIAWLGENFSVTTNPVAKGANMMLGWHYYYLYGLERAGVLTQQEFFGTHGWYVEGAKFLVGTQKANGSWDSASNPQHPAAGPNGNVLADTCFAVLFLKRATTPVNVPLRVPRPVITGE